MLEQRASDLSSLLCTWVPHWNFVIDPTYILAFWSNKSVGLRVLKHQGLSIFPVHTHSQVSAPAQRSPSVSSVWQTGGSGWYNVLPWACRAQRALSVQGPRPSSWKQTSRIPLDYRHIWTNLNLRPRNNYFFSSERRGSNQPAPQKCLWSEAKIKRSNVVVLHFLKSLLLCL